MSMKFSSNRVIERAARFGGIAILLLTIPLVVACEPEAGLDSVDAEAPVPTEQADVPEEAEIGEGTEGELSGLIGETVTVSTEITEKISDNLFSIYDVESLRGEEVLAVTNLPIPETGTNIEVTGVIMELDQEAIQSAYAITLDPEVVEAYTGKPYLNVEALEPVD